MFKKIFKKYFTFSQVVFIPNIGGYGGMVDTSVLGTDGASLGGSSPSIRTSLVVVFVL